jgi:Flp pilus assembly protein TadG
MGRVLHPTSDFRSIGNGESKMNLRSKLPDNKRDIASLDVSSKNCCTSSPEASAATRSPGALLRTSLRGKLRAGLGNSSETGAAVVEMALVLPIMMLLVTGIFAFGTAFNNYVELTNAVNIGGRLLAIDRLNTTDPCADAVAAIEHAAPYLKPASLQFSFVLNTTAYPANTTSCSSSSTTTGAAANLIQSDPVTVTVTYPCNLGVYGKNLVPGCTLTAQVTELEQ